MTDKLPVAASGESSDLFVLFMIFIFTFVLNDTYKDKDESKIGGQKS